MGGMGRVFWACWRVLKYRVMRVCLGVWMGGWAGGGFWVGIGVWAVPDVGVSSWAEESQTNSWVRLVFSRKRIRAEATEAWWVVGTSLRPKVVGMESVSPIDRRLAVNFVRWVS